MATTALPPKYNGYRYFYCGEYSEKNGGPRSTSKDMAKRIVNKYDLTYISVGKLIEKEIQEKTPIGKSAETNVRAGDLVIPGIVVWLLKREMLNMYQCSKGYVIEGFPRTQKQLVRFENEVARAHIVLFLSVDNSTLGDMFLTSRMNENERQRLLSRVCNYQKYTAPLKDNIGKRCKVIRGGGGTAWRLLDQALAKMMVEWCFLKEDVTGVEDLYCGRKVKIHYPGAPVASARGEQKKEFGERMFETLGGVIPYFVRRDCTRKPLG